MSPSIHERAEQLDKQLNEIACQSGFVVDKNRAHLAAIESALREVVEECAKVCERDVCIGRVREVCMDMQDACEMCAAAIRRLKGEG